MTRNGPGAGGLPHTGFAPAPLSHFGRSGTNRARIANPAGGPDQFHAKRGTFIHAIPDKAEYGIVRGIRAISEESLKTFTGINPWPNGCRIVLGRGGGL